MNEKPKTQKQVETKWQIKKTVNRPIVFLMTALFLLIILIGPALARDLDEIRKSGKLRHLGIVYANFIREDQTGFDMDMMRMFADYLGVSYDFVKTTWSRAIPDLTGKVVKPKNDEIEIIGEQPQKGDVIATGMTVLPWRKKIVAFSEITFPTGIWLIARADLPIQPITPSGNIERDIEKTRHMLKGLSVLSLKNSCLDADLYGLAENGAIIKLFSAEQNLKEMIPTVMSGHADTTIMDVPVVLMALTKWPGEIKVIGPVSPKQGMACAFSKSAPKLRMAFNTFFRQCKKDGRYERLIRKYYPSLPVFYPDSIK